MNLLLPPGMPYFGLGLWGAQRDPTPAPNARLLRADLWLEKPFEHRERRSPRVRPDLHHGPFTAFTTYDILFVKAPAILLWTLSSLSLCEWLTCYFATSRTTIGRRRYFG